MNWLKQSTGTAVELQPDKNLEEALQNFRQSVHAWSDAECKRPREVRVAVRSPWRPALAWALGCAVIAGGVSGGVYDHHRNVVERQQAAARMAHEHELAEQQKAQENDESLLANVDTDVSRSVPAAMEPLAQLMEDDGTNY
jgi:hypothetical protein